MEETLLPLDWTKIGSSRIRRAKYVPNKHDLRGNLVVEFNEGKVYTFKDVPQNKVEKMIHHSSPGCYFNSDIRGHHDAERTDE